MSYDQAIHSVQQNINSLVHQLAALSPNGQMGPMNGPMNGPMYPQMDMPAVSPQHMHGAYPPMGNSMYVPQMQMSPHMEYPHAHMAHQMHTMPQFSQHTPPRQVSSNNAMPRYVNHSASKVQRAPLGELPMNSAMSVTESPVDPIKALFERERTQRVNIQRLELTESARLEMNIQNVNIRRYSHSQRVAELAASPHARTPKQGEVEAPCPKTCEREENEDGTIKYDFSSGLPGGACVYFMKGYCGIGNKCRYVHDATDAGAIVKITGMPYTCTVQDIISFFSPLSLTERDVTFIVSKEGKQSGSAFVEFGSRKDALFALGKDRNFITAHRFVLLYPSSKIEREWFLNNPMPFSAHATPATQKKHDVASPKVFTPAPAAPITPQSITQRAQSAYVQPLMQSPLLNQLNAAAAVSMLQASNAAEEQKELTPVKQLSFDENVCP